MSLIEKIQNLIAIKPHDTSNEYGRSQERYRAATWSILSNVFSKTMGMILMLTSVKLTVPYLGADRFGVWLTIASFAGIFSFFDMGIGNALTNRVAYSASRLDRQELQQTISSGIMILTIVGLITAGILITIAQIIPWYKIIKVNSPALHEEIQLSCIVFGGLFGLHIVASGIQKIFLGLQQAYIANIASAIGYLLSLTLLFSTLHYYPDIPTLIVMTLGCSILINFSLILILVKKHLFIPAKIARSFNPEYKKLITNGGLFFILQIGTMVIWGADSLIISSTLGAAQVAVFGVTQRMFQVISQPVMILNTPLWSAYADANARSDRRFIKRTLKISLLINISVSTILGLPLIFWGSEISQYLTNTKITVPLILIVAFFLWTICDSLGSTFAIFLNGCNIVKPQIYAVSALIVLSIPIKFYSIKTYGLEEMIFIFTALYLSIIIVMYGFFFKKDILKKINDN